MRTSLFLALFWAVNLAGQTATPESHSPVHPIFKTKEEAERAGDAAFSEGTRLFKEQTSDARPRGLVKFQEAAADYGAALDKQKEASALDQCGIAAEQLNQVQNALKFYQKALAIEYELGDRRGEAKVLTHIGISYDDLGEKQKALDYYAQALPIQREVRDRRGEAATLGNIGTTYADLGQNQNALNYDFQALAIMRELRDRAAEGEILNNIGTTYYELGEMQKALDYLAQALPIRREVGDRIEEADTLNNIGSVYVSLGQKQKGLDYCTQALAVEREVGNRRDEAMTLNNIGKVYEELGQVEKALDYYRQSLPIRREVGDPLGEANTLNNIGSAYKTIGQKQKGLEYYAQALQIWQDVGDRAGEAETLDNIGKVHDELGQKQKALDYYARALPIEQDVGDRSHEARTLGNLMSALRQDEPGLAILFGKESVNMYQSLRRDISGLSKEIQQGYAKSNEGTYRELADLLVTQGRLLEAQKVLDLLKQEEYFDFIRRSGSVGGTESVAVTARDMMPLVMIEKERESLLGKAKLTPLQQKRKEFLDAQMIAAKLAVSEFFDERGKVKAVGNTVLASTESRDEEKEAHALQKLLQRSPGAVALYTLVGENTYHTLLITPYAMKAREWHITAAALRKKVFAWREALRSPSTDPMPMAKDLYVILIGDLDQELEAAHATTLVWSLDDVLRYVPMAALNDGQHYLAARYRNVIRTKATDVGGKLPMEWKAFAAGVSEARDGLPPLAGVDEELHSIFYKEGATHSRGVMPATPDILMNGQFSADAFRAGLHQNLPLVHIASHFVLGANDAASYLLLGSGKLSLAELRTSDDYTFNNVDLLTLSACDSAVASDSGDGHEIDGFGFLAEDKGARAVMASLWEVYDPSTSAFMQRFYAELSRDSKISKAEALQRAQLALLQVGPESAPGDNRGFAKQQPAHLDRYPNYSHPYFWAPFVLMGDWN